MNTTRQENPAFGWMTVLLIAVVGLFYVKWFPYYNRAFVAAANIRSAQSILMGDGGERAGAVAGAALDYAWPTARRSGRRWCSACCWARPCRRCCRPLGREGCSAGPDSAASRRRPDGDPGHDVHLLRRARRRRACASVRPRRAARSRSGSATRCSIRRRWSSWASCSAGTGRRCGWCWALLMVFGLGYLVNRMVTPQEAEAARGAACRAGGGSAGTGAFMRWLESSGA